MFNLKRSLSGRVLGATLAACLLMTGAASAQSRLVPASEFYFAEEARTTRPVVAIQGEGDALTEALLKVIARKPRAHAETAQLAHVAMSGGRPELGVELYERVLRDLSTTEVLYRPVLWNYGWDLLRTGDPEAALERWDTLVKARNVTADWMPTTFALALWQLDRKDEAVEWYAAAVRTHPDRWSYPDRYEELLPDWLPAERETLVKVQQAWQADPPQWR
ncbi:tetratricopeptide repeat protein [Lysobacter sp. A03]|uniref:tetratricopeptide repeat protein n=1 Tax=Lysobacter sp. A03 TaxID=1199154 RepID=UPI0005B73815|nr:tetratricopeptide repeat protein [Lysobacter sp. A03]KIQ96174.1 TPR repeat [Lysobacter sp. A03]